MEFHVTLLRYASTEYFIGFASDISERKAHDAHAWRLAHLDDLTGLPNRRLFFAQASAAPCHGVAVISLDCVEAVNDSMGPEIGDELLRAVAGRIAGRLRPGETLARLAGPDFALAMPPGSSPLPRIQELLDLIGAPVEMAGRRIVPAGVVGLATASPADTSVGALLRNAELALHEARRGRLRFLVHSPEMTDVVVARLTMETALRHAITNDELVLHFQPQWDAAHDRMIGAEALVRWQQDGALVPPSQFIPIAEERGLIVPLGDWVIENTCAAIARWRRLGLPLLPVAVNVAPQQLSAPGFRDRLLNALDEHGVTPDLIELEITENSLIEDASAVAELVHLLKRDGFRLAIDDFGTGFSSLAYLRRLPIDKLKIDRSFIQDLPDDAESASIVRAIIDLSRSLGIGVLAEGVELEEQARYLARLSCTRIQGYVFSRPLPEQAFVEKLAQAGGVDGASVRTRAP